MEPFKASIVFDPIMDKYVVVPDENGKWLVSGPPLEIKRPINPDHYTSGIDPYEQKPDL